jgi:signal transduction histidine kinase
MATNKISILMIEDNPGDARLILLMLNSTNLPSSTQFKLTIAENLSTGLEHLSSEEFEVVLLDLSLPDSFGIDSISKIRKLTEKIPIIVLTSLEDETVGISAMQQGAQDYLIKGQIDTQLLSRTIIYSIERSRLSASMHDLLQREQEARAEAEKANRAKDDFLAVLSHELRSPLTAIIGWATLLNKGLADSSLTTQALEVIERLARSQAYLIDDILDVSRIVAGKIKIDPKPVNLVGVIENAIDVVKPSAEAKSIRLEFVTQSCIVLGDRARLQQVIWNLLTNAVKFTQVGGYVHIELKNIGSSAVVEVKDNGQGISTDFLPLVFDRFQQAETSSTRRSNGLGLGLAIVSHMVTLHGGTIAVESEGEGKGATFTLTLPLMNLNDEANIESFKTEGKAFEYLPSLKDYKIVVVDDDVYTLELVTMLLKKCGAEVKACDSVHNALKTIEDWKPNLLVSDICMPVEDGYSLIQKIRRMESEEGKHVPAIALTGYAGIDDKMLALQSGYNMHIPKPVEPSKLVSAIVGLGSSS